jgi:hypothetical protein
VDVAALHCRQILQLFLGHEPRVAEGRGDCRNQYAFSRIACRSVIHRILKSSPSDQFSM